MYKCITNHHLVKILMNNKVVCKLPQKYHVWKRKQKQWIYIYIYSKSCIKPFSIDRVNQSTSDQSAFHAISSHSFLDLESIFILPSIQFSEEIRWRDEEKFKKAVERYGMDLKTSLYIACISKKERKKGYLFCADDLAS